MSKAKTRQQIAEELGISARTLTRWIKREKLDIPRGSLCEKHQKLIHDTFLGI